MWFSNRSDTNRAVRAEKIFKLEISDLAKTKALIAKLVCAFVFVYAYCWFSCVAAQLAHNNNIAT